ncbi:MAG: ABC transporter ATP-binding protein [Porphyromonas sp.]|nr:ABC transporter ATP-binding protein [Porphyromonas sp.]
MKHKEIVIEARDLTKSFGELEIIKGISLSVNRREIIGIVGASGAGKTTLLQLLSTLDRPDSGTVVINGTDINRLSSNEQATFRNRHIGFVFQFHQLMPEFTAQENVAIPAMIKGESKSRAMERARQLLEQLHLGERLEHKPAALSGGEKQRVAVARALINQPSIIFADEPTGALDSGHKEELHELFLQLREEIGQTFIIVSHDPTLSEIADRTVLIEDGRVKSETARA